MRILLLGEYSNVHNTLAKGLRQLGHEVTVASNGDFWKDYPRDIDLSRREGKLGGLLLWAKLMRNLSHFMGYDIVQLINPMFFELKAARLHWFYHFLRQHNKKIVLGAFGMDSYWVRACREKGIMRYSDFNLGNTLRNDQEAQRYVNDWIGTEKEQLNKMIATDCDAVVAGLWEYHMAYMQFFPGKTTFIPYPVELPANRKKEKEQHKIKLFIGINKTRNKYKGTDIMLEGARKVVDAFPETAELKVVENVPFNEYQQRVEQADVMLDQLYSYTPAMNALLAMSKGVVVVGGGEEEHYALLHPHTPRAIVNVQPTLESVTQKLTELIKHRTLLEQLQKESVQYIRLNHDYIGVAEKYVRLYERL